MFFFNEYESWGSNSVLVRGPVGKGTGTLGTGVYCLLSSPPPLQFFEMSSLQTTISYETNAMLQGRFQEGAPGDSGPSTEGLPPVASGWGPQKRITLKSLILRSFLKS